MGDIQSEDIIAMKITELTHKTKQPAWFTAGFMVAI
jgi:hypothetical protein